VDSKSANILTFGIQKGGCGKTTTTGIMAYLLAKDGNRVLVCDMDSQGNTTELLTNETSNETIGKSILEAMYERDPLPYIQNVRENLDLLGSNNLLVTMVDYFYTGKTWDNRDIGRPSNRLNILAETLDKVKDRYDYILIDTPPALGIETMNSIFSSNHVVVLYESSKFCYSAIPNFLETVEACIGAGNTELQIAGIIRNLTDARRSDMKMFAEILADDYPELVFEEIVRRSASAGRLSLNGFDDNPELEKAVEQYKTIYKELLQRVEQGQMAR
jgi:chromosome partitioning protein